MEQLKLFQKKPLKVILVGIGLLLVVIVGYFFGETPLLQLLMLFGIGMALVGYKVRYTITKSFANKKELFFLMYH